MSGNQHTLRNLQWIIWSVLFGMLFFYILETENSFAEACNYSINTVLYYAIIIYGNALWLMPRLYRKKKYLLYGGSVLLLLVGITFVRLQVQSYIWYTWIIKKPYHHFLKDYAYMFIIHSLLYVLSVAFRYTLDFFQIEQQQEKLLKQHAEAQLNLLKAQVQPHFLFNTLNNIYFVAQRESQATADLLEKLSSIMRYFLEQGPQHKISLADELDFINNYIELEKMRIRYPVHVAMNIDAGNGEFRLPPMLLIPLVENVFKHGIDKSKEDNYISIDLRITDRFHFEVKNTLPEAVRQSDMECGTGLKNLSERLRILYAGDFVLKSSRVGNLYVSSLNIPL